MAYFSEGARLPRGQGNLYLPAIALVKAGGARYYDPQISACLVVKRTRWLSVDPLSHKYPSLSAYVFVANNSINATDPDGKRIKPLNRGAYKSLIGVLGGFTENYSKLFGLHVSRNAKGQVGAITATAVYEDFKAFKKAAKKEGVSKENMEAAYGVYLKLAEKKTTELLMIKSAEATTIGIGGDKASSVGESSGYEKMRTDNPNYAEFVKNIKENGALNEELRQDVFENDKYKSDQSGEDWVFFRDFNTYGQNQGMIKGVIIFDGTSNDQLIMQQAVLDAILNLNW